MKNSQLFMMLIFSSAIGGVVGGVVTNQLNKDETAETQITTLPENASFDTLSVKTITADQIVSSTKDGKITFTVDKGSLTTNGEIKGEIIRSDRNISKFLATDDLRAGFSSARNVIISDNPFGDFNKQNVYAELGYQPTEGGVFFVRNKDSIKTREQKDPGVGYVWHLGFQGKVPALYARHFDKGATQGNYVVGANYKSLKAQASAAPKVTRPIVEIQKE